MTAFNIDTTPFDTSGYVKLTWNNTGQRATHQSYRVYRAPHGTNVWTMLAEITTTAVNYEYDDYLAGSQVEYDYAVDEVYLSGATVTEEPKNPQYALPITTNYWLINTTTTPITAFKVFQVTGDSFHNEYDFTVMKIIGKGRKVDQGDNWGVTGALSGKIYSNSTRTARQARLQLEALKAAETYYYLKNPFGDVWKVFLEDINFTRVQGVALSEFLEISFNYWEVA